MTMLLHVLLAALCLVGIGLVIGWGLRGLLDARRLRVVVRQMMAEQRLESATRETLTQMRRAARECLR